MLKKQKKIQMFVSKSGTKIDPYTLEKKNKSPQQCRWVKDAAQ